MKRVPALLLAVAIAALAAAPVRAQTESSDHQSIWWSWGDGNYGLTFGGVSYGSGRDRVVGSDKLIHQVRPIAGVTGIEVRGPINVVLKQAPAEKLTVHTDDNLVDFIETTVSDGTLRIGVKEGASFRSRHRLGVTVEVPHLRAVRLMGSGDLTCADFETDLLELTIHGSGDARFDALRAGTVAVLIQGSGDVHLSGSTPKQGYVIEGSGDLDASELAGREVAVRINGSGDAHVWSTASLSVDINGSGDVRYRGRPTIRKSINGSGDLMAD